MNPSSGHSTTTKAILGSGAVQISSGRICEVTEVRTCSQGRPSSHLLTPHHPPEKRRRKITTFTLLALSADTQTGGRWLAEGTSHLKWPDGPVWHAWFSQVVWS